MAVLKNQRWERFAQGLAAGKNTDKAYVAAGFTKNQGNASRLKGTEIIQRRVAEILGRGAERAAVTVQSLIDEIDEVLAAARLDDDHAAAISAIREKAVLAGKRITRQETRLVDDFEEMTESQIRAFIAEKEAALKAGKTKH